MATRLKINGISDDLSEKLNSKYTESDAVRAAGEEASAKYAALNGYQSNGKADAALTAWKNYGDFSYDPDTDPLYQNAKANAMRNGKIAMQDTIGQASALTGGYANSYAETAGSAAYQNYLSQLDNSMTDYYRLALDNYNNQKNELLTEYSLEKDREDNEYNRLYNLYSIAQDRYNNERTFDYGQYSDDYSRAASLASMENSDWWNQANYDESKRQYDASLAEQQRQYDIDLAASKAAAASSDYHNIDGYIGSWSNKLIEAGDDATAEEKAKETIAREASTLFMNGDIDENTLLTIVDRYIGIENLDSYDLIKKYFGMDIAGMLKNKSN